MNFFIVPSEEQRERNCKNKEYMDRSRVKETSTERTENNIQAKERMATKRARETTEDQSWTSL